MLNDEILSYKHLGPGAPRNVDIEQPIRETQVNFKGHD